MDETSPGPGPCAACGREGVGRVDAGAIREALQARVRAAHPGWSGEGPVCRRCVLQARVEDLRGRLEGEQAELSVLEAELSARVAGQEAAAATLDEEFERRATFGERVADRVARVGGSWTFVFAVLGGIAAWMAAQILLTHPVDPFPFILLNLALSCVAALQAPIIMMSQNRSSAHDRAKADRDYLTNLKAEIEVASLHQKVDHILHAQWERMVELQEVQLELLEELHGKVVGA